MHLLKHLIILFILFTTFTTLSQKDLPITDGRLDGKYSNFNSENKMTTQGEFKNNLPHGEWTVIDSSNQVVLTRQYHSIYSYTEKRINETDHNEESEINFPLERHSSGLYTFPPVENSKVVWSKRVRSVLPKNQNEILYSQDYLSKIESLTKTEEFTLYENNELSEILSPESIDFDNSELLTISLKKDYFFDKKLKMMQERIVAITFHLKNPDSGTESNFHVFYPTDGRKLFSSFKISHDDEHIQTVDDIFFFKNYGEIIYQQEDFDSEKPLDLENTDNYKKESDGIKRQILEVEHRYWL